MAASITAVEKTGGSSWTYYYTGTSPFSLYQDGKLIEGLTTEETEWQAFDVNDSNEPPALEIQDDTESDPESLAYPPYAILQWRFVSDAQYYRVDQYVAAAWTAVQVKREEGWGYYQYESGALDDITTHQFRVYAVDEDGNDGTALPFDIHIIRNPERPSITGTYAAGDLTIAEA
ncbi:MAG: hypothetical protein GY832_22035 [Chloroflexi bacterium]|nr:hypothetical protein [Chloroflexota bacterium]